MTRWKYERFKSIVHSWESEGTRAHYNRKPAAVVVPQTCGVRGSGVTLLPTQGLKGLKEV